MSHRHNSLVLIGGVGFSVGFLVWVFCFRFWGFFKAD